MKYSIESLLETGILIAALLFYLWRNKKRCYLVAKIIHLSIAISGLLLVAGGAVTEYVDGSNSILQGIGEILGVWFALLLIPAGASLLVIVLLRWNELHIVIPTVLLGIFLAILWYANGLTEMVSLAFMVYAIVTLYLLLGKGSGDTGSDASA